MSINKGTLAIITARSGSKGLKDKNIKPLHGRPMIAYTIQAAQQSGIFDQIMVSTDSVKYAEVAERFGASVPFLRSDKASSDHASTRDVILEVLNEYGQLGLIFDRFMILQPTSPLRTADNIRAAQRIFDEKNAKGVVSVCEVDHSPLWCNTLPEDGSLNGFIQTAGNARRQNLDTYYRINGAIYLFDSQYYMHHENVYGSDVYAYIMDKRQSIDIDDQFDFMIAEAIMKNGAL